MTIKLQKSLLKKAALAACILTVSTSTFAGWTKISNQFNNYFYGVGQTLSMYTLDCGHFYAGGNIGMSRLHDRRNNGSTNSVNQIGPGWSVVGGYQFNSILGGELGYTQYHNSRESSGGTIIAKTEHYSVHAAATGRYPLMYKWSLLGKLGLAYNYAQKMAIGAGTAKSAGPVSWYYGLGLDYSLTKRYDIIAQVAEAYGNRQTGSTDLYSIGLNVALV